MKIRLAMKKDLIRINEIYNQAVVESTATFDLEPMTMEARKWWFQRHDSKYPAIVAVDEADEVIGWGSLAPFAERPAYRFSVEHSIYVDSARRRQGAGKTLLESLIGLAKENHYHTMLARITGENRVSIDLHLKYGFEEAGVLKEVGYKFDRWLDVVILQKKL